MARGILRQQPIKASDQFYVPDNQKLQMSLIALADKYSDKVRNLVAACYEDVQLLQLYKAIRTSGIYQHGGKSKVYRKVVEFPNGWVYDFCDTIMTELYGPDWLSNNRALRHELIKPWWVVERL